jgi:hypothetical protein
MFSRTTGRENVMTKISLFIAGCVIAASALAAPAPAAAQSQYPWCAQYGSSFGGGRNCGFTSYRQCLATVSGVGGFCERNQFYEGRRRR